MSIMPSWGATTAGDGFGHGGVNAGVSEQFFRADGRDGFLEGYVIRIDQAKVEAAEVTHCAGDGADVERIPGFDQDDGEVVERGRRHRGVCPGAKKCGTFRAVRDNSNCSRVKKHK